MKTLLIITLLAGFTKPNNFAVTTAPGPKPKEINFTISKDVDITTVDGNTVTLRAGTPIVVETSQTYNAKNLTEGQTVNFRVKYNVVVSKQTLVAAGALGTANITDIVRPGVFGKGGKIELQIQSVQAVDGQQILLSGIAMVSEGQNKKGLAWGLSAGLFVLGLFVFAPLILGGAAGFLVKGKPAEIKAGTNTNASVASDAQVEVEEARQTAENNNKGTERNMTKRQ
jgi:hypothetical protein